jgi:hypothetical protein
LQAVADVDPDVRDTRLVRIGKEPRGTFSQLERLGSAGPSGQSAHGYYLDFGLRLCVAKLNGVWWRVRRDWLPCQLDAALHQLNTAFQELWSSPKPPA